MTVKFNLLPEEYRDSEKKEGLKPSFVLFISIFIFMMALGIAVAGVGIIKIFAMRSEISGLDVNRDVMKIQSEKLTQELARLKDQEAILVATNELFEKDMPILELLKQVALSIPGGVWLSSLSAESDNTLISGFSYNENDVVLFATGLAQSPIVRQVGFPNTKRITKDGHSVVEFRLNCVIGQSEIVSGEVTP